jgi:hypothetical protein
VILNVPPDQAKLSFVEEGGPSSEAAVDPVAAVILLRRSVTRKLGLYRLASELLHVSAASGALHKGGDLGGRIARMANPLTTDKNRRINR